MRLDEKGARSLAPASLPGSDAHRPSGPATPPQPLTTTAHDGRHSGHPSPSARRCCTPSTRPSATRTGRLRLARKHSVHRCKIGSSRPRRRRPRPSPGARKTPGGRSRSAGERMPCGPMSWLTCRLSGRPPSLPRGSVAARLPGTSCRFHRGQASHRGCPETSLPPRLPGTSCRVRRGLASHRGCPETRRRLTGCGSL